MPSGGFSLRYGACFGGPGRVDRSKLEIGLAFDSRGLGAVSQCPQGAARLDLEAEPAGSRLAQFLSCRYSNRLWRLRRFLSCGFGLGQRPGRACFVGGHRRRLDCAYSGRSDRRLGAVEAGPGRAGDRDDRRVRPHLGARTHIRSGVRRRNPARPLWRNRHARDCGDQPWSRRPGRDVGKDRAQLRFRCRRKCSDRRRDGRCGTIHFQDRDILRSGGSLYPGPRRAQRHPRR